jgi:hypothetical protein
MIERPRIFARASMLWLSTVVAWALLTAPSQAQMPTPDPAIYAPDYATLINQDTFLRQSMRPVTPQERTRERKRAHRPRRATARELRRLRYASRESVTAALRPLLIDRLTDGFDARWDESFRDDIERKVNDGTYLRGFASGIKETHGQARNLADAASVATLMLFGAYELEQGSAPQLDARGARRYILDNRQTFAQHRRLRRMTAPAKQREAETLGTIAVHALSFQAAMYAFAAQGTAEASFAAGYLDRNRQLIREFLRKQLHFDVTAYRLTSKGFVRS